jgi:RecB family exonuclease
LEAEERHCRASAPRYFEVALGLRSVADGTPLDDEQPLSLSLPGGGAILLRGQIDRVDELAAATFGVWDYKISSGYGYAAGDPFQQGRRVQSALYLGMIEAALRARLDAQARVASFGYFFPSVKARGLRIAWPADALAEGLATVERLCRLIAAGAFPATHKLDDCTYCDYRGVCGDLAQATRASADLLERSDLVPLTAFRELRRG